MHTLFKSLATVSLGALLLVPTLPKEQTPVINHTQAAPQPVQTAKLVSAVKETPKPVEPATQPVQKPQDCTAAYDYDWPKNIAYAVCMAESSGNTHAVGDTWVINGVYAPSCGLMQVRTLKGRPSCEELQNPQVNMEWAYRLYKAHGFQPWSMYLNGRYQRYL